MKRSELLTDENALDVERTYALELFDGESEEHIGFVASLSETQVSALCYGEIDSEKAYHLVLAWNPTSGWIERVDAWAEVLDTRESLSQAYTEVDFRLLEPNEAVRSEIRAILANDPDLAREGSPDPGDEVPASLSRREEGSL